MAMREQGRVRDTGVAIEAPPEGYVLNPALKLRFSCEVRTKGRPVRTVEFDAKPDGRELYMLLDAIRRSEDPNAALASLPPQAIDALAHYGFVVRPGEACDSVEFRCGLDPSLIPFLPRSAAREAADSDWVARPGTALQRAPERPAIPGFSLPPSNEYPRSDRLAEGSDCLLWVPDEGTGMVWPYSIEPAFAERLEPFFRGELEASRLTREEREMLRHAGALVAPGSPENRRRCGTESAASAHRDLVEKKFCVLRDLVPPLQLAAMRRYYRAMESEGYMVMDLKQVKRMRSCLQNDPISRYLHRQTGSLMRKATGETIIPSYSFISAYYPGAELERHVDRFQCRWNGSLLVDCDPETSLEDSWPIHLDVAGKVESVRLGMGDCLVYSGTEIPHWRDPLQRDRRQTLALLHYVPVDFVGNLD